jgi:hypothetical protein
LDDGYRPSPKPLLRRVELPFDGATVPDTEQFVNLTEHLGIRDINAISTEPPKPLLIDRLDPEGHTILYGPGGVGKGTTASYWITRLLDENHRVLILDYEDHPTEWARRVGSLSLFGVPEGRVAHVSPLAPTWHGLKGAIWDHQADIKDAALAMGATYLVVDSIVPACAGADASSGKTDVTSQYAAALQYIGLPALSIGHVTKEGDGRYPFGSVFWHNLARVTWSLARAGNGETVTLSHRKHNNYAKQANTSISVTWHDGKPVEYSERPTVVVMADLLEEVLTEPMTIKQILEQLDLSLEDGDQPYKRDTIKHALTRGISARPQRFRLSGDTWSRA